MVLPTVIRSTFPMPRVPRFLRVTPIISPTTCCRRQRARVSHAELFTLSMMVPISTNDYSMPPRTTWTWTQHNVVWHNFVWDLFAHVPIYTCSLFDIAWSLFWHSMVPFEKFCLFALLYHVPILFNFWYMLVLKGEILRRESKKRREKKITTPPEWGCYLFK